MMDQDKALSAMTPHEGSLCGDVTEITSSTQLLVMTSQAGVFLCDDLMGPHGTS
jgi:hypothetical protein